MNTLPDLDAEASPLIIVTHHEHTTYLVLIQEAFLTCIIPMRLRKDMLLVCTPSPGLYTAAR